MCQTYQAYNFSRVAGLIMLLPVAEAKADLFDVERSNDGGGGGADSSGDSGSNAGHSNSTSYIKNTVSSECECDARTVITRSSIKIIMSEF